MLSVIEIAIITVVVVLLLSRRSGKSSANCGRRGVAKALVFTGAICLLLVSAVVGVKVVRESNSGQAPVARSLNHSNQRFSSGGIVVHDSESPDRSIVIDVRTPSVPVVPPLSGIAPPMAEQPDPSGALAVRPPAISTTPDGKMLVLPLSGQVLVDLLGEEGAAAVEALNNSLSPEMRQAYAMIPISTPSTVPSVFNGAVAPSVLKHACSPTALNIWRRAAAEFMSSIPEKSGKQAVETSIAPMLAEAGDSEMSTYQLAKWVEHPPAGQLVVKSRMKNYSIPPAEALNSEITAALKARISEITAEELNIADDWQKAMDLKLSDAAVDRFIVDTDFSPPEIVTTLDGDHKMKRTYALVQFPTSAEDQIINKLQTTLKQNRLIVLCVALASVWLCATCVSVAARATKSTSFLRRMVTLPAMGLVMVPCLLAFAVLTRSMMRGEIVQLQPLHERSVCVIDK